MIQLIKNIQFKYKLLLCFLALIVLNALAGIFSYRLVGDISQLVYTTYDKALMTASFSQATKAHYFKFELDVKAALLATTYKDYKIGKINSKRALDTMLEDLAVVRERALEEKIRVLVDEVQEQIQAITIKKDELLNLKQAALDKNVTDLNSSIALWNEWEKNSNTKKLGRKLTLISDEAAVIGYQFRLDSQKKNEESLRNVILVVSVCAVLAIIFSIIMSFIIVSPLVKLKDACKEIGDGDFSTRAPIEAKDEVGRLAFSFNQMLDVIEEKDSNINSLLTALPFGLFYFDNTGTISIERSQSTLKLFKEFDQYKTIIDFFNAHQVKTEMTEKIVGIIFKNQLPFESAVNLFPKRIVVNEGDRKLQIELSFKKKLNSDNKVEKVIVIAEDITKEVEALAKNQSLTEKVGRVSKASEDIESFREFLQAANQLFLNINKAVQKLGENSKLVDLRRDLHSLKGLVEVYGFSTCSKQIHHIETILSDTDFAEKLDELKEQTSQSIATFKEHSDDIVAILAIDQSDELKLVDINKISTIKKLAEQSQIPDLVKAVQSLNKFPLNKVFKKYVSYTNQVVQSLGDKEAALLFNPSSDEITYEEGRMLDSALVHIIRNSIDHGIESTAAREKASKSRVGAVNISCTREKGSLNFLIQDDGKGINADLLAQKATEKGLWSEEQLSKASHDEKVNLIFASSFSTKEEVSELSGRGVGMDAVKDLVESLGGQIAVETSLGLGTNFKISIPTDVL
ncbi:MAG: hypothetical protein CME71_03240 [Halobacteriovorax sp.]|nr:hypothetical protein [Halobacteriovorax sp.]